MSSKRLTILFASSVIFGLVVALLLWGGEVLAPESSDDMTTSQRTEKVSDEDVRITLTIDSEFYEYGDTIRLSVDVENEGDEVRVFNFNSGCTDADIYINESKVEQSRACTLALVDVALDPGDEQAWEFEYEVVSPAPDSTGGIPNFDGKVALEAGSHTVRAEWNELATDNLSFQVRE